MFKKLTIAALALLLVGGLLFGRNLVPYASTALDKVKRSVNDSIPIEHQLDTARKQLNRIGPEIKQMRYEIAKEMVSVKRLNEQLAQRTSAMESQQTKILALRDHLETGESYFVSHGKAYTNNQVRRDLENRFNNFRTSEKTIEKLSKIVELRSQGLTSAQAKLDETIAQARELEVQIENLAARLQMVEVAKTANKFTDFDNSELARTREMIDQIGARIDVETEMMNMLPDNIGTIPVDEESTEFEGDIVNEIDAYFSKVADTDVAKN